MFRTSIVPSSEEFLCCMLKFGMSVVVRVKEELQFFLHPHNNRTYRDIPNCNVQHKNAPEDGLLNSVTC